jgi:hypothetical protein
MVLADWFQESHEDSTYSNVGELDRLTFLEGSYEYD